jgi:hypothetical protein
MITNSALYQKDARLAIDEASRLYHAARRRAQLGKLYSALTGRSRRLFHLSAIQLACHVRDRHHAGTQAVPIDHIRGSEGRCEEFDVNFWPLQTRTKGRWLSIALAHYMGESLPAVELIQVGELYFVRDGHHRISVAKALGQIHIDAQVTVWEVKQATSLEHPDLVHHPSYPAGYQKSSCLVETGGRLARL